MNTMRSSVVPKSDQLNFEDFIGNHTITIKITKVVFLGGDQPFAFHYEGDNGKPYKPCKSMRRIIIYCWGDDGNHYIGRSMTLYGDAKVKFGGLEVGGIRISHMSDISAALTMALTATRASRKPFTVQPLGANVQDAIAGIFGATTLEALKAIFGQHYKNFNGENRNKIVEAYEQRKIELTPKQEINDEQETL